MQNIARRLGVLTLVTTVGAGLALVAPGPATAVVSADAAPVAGGAAWLEAQVTNGVIHNDQYDFDDYGLSIDVALGLDAVGGHDDSVQAVADTIAANLAPYTSYASGDSTHVLAGSLAKALALAVAADRDGSAFGGTDLVADLEAQVVATGPAAGRIQDTFDAAQPFESDFSNTVGQAYAVTGLDAEGSALADAATDFLLLQQCNAGFFRVGFSAKDAADQSCDAATPAATGDVDTTALAVVALLPQVADTDVAGALEAAVTWLLAQQGEDGAFGGGEGTEGDNTNSTGLAAAALGRSGEVAAAAEAATWVAARQITDLPCSSSAAGTETGAIAYDEAARAAAGTEGIRVETSDQFRRATSQALPGLLWLESARTTAPLTLSGPTGLRRAGSMIRLDLSGLGDGERACVRGTLVTGPATAAVVKLPAGTAVRTFRAVRLGAPSSSTSVKVLGAKKLPFVVAKSRVRRTQNESVKVTGLASGERVRVFLRGKRVGGGTANGKGVFFTRFPVGSRLGKANVKVVGQFANRTNTKTIRVTR